MKNLKLLTIGLALLAGMALSSCNNKSESPSVWAGVVRVNFDGSFTDATGIKLVPTNPSLSTTAAMAYIYCQVNGEQPADAKTHSITLMANPIGIDATAFPIPTPGSPADRSANAATYTLTVTTGYYELTPSFFDRNILVLPIAFFLKKNISDANLADEVAKHTFELVYYTDSAESGDTEMNLHLRHRVSDPEVERRDDKTWAYKAYDISNLLANFKTATGQAKPSRIVIHVAENNTSDKLSDADDKTYPINYSFDN